MSEYSSIELGEIEMYGMTSAELDKQIKTSGEIVALRFYEYQTSKAFRESNYEEALRAFNRVRYIIDVRLFPEQ
ncbi:MAG: hypothetical protein AB1598_04935 [Thermodesulfobacteriota bacterium]